MEEIYLFSLPVKEFQIIDFFLPTIKDEVMCIAPVQKQTSAGQRTRFKACVAVGDFDGHVGLGVKCSKEVAGAIRGAIIAAKLAIIPVRRGYWGSHIAEPHTIPMKVSGKCGSVMCRLIPAPRGTGIVAAPASKRLLQMAGVQDVYTQSKGSTATTSNFMKATFVALAKSYQILTPDLWREIAPGQTPYDQVRAVKSIKALPFAPMLTLSTPSSTRLTSPSLPRRPTKRVLLAYEPCRGRSGRLWVSEGSWRAKVSAWLRMRSRVGCAGGIQLPTVLYIRASVCPPAVRPASYDSFLFILLLEFVSLLMSQVGGASGGHGLATSAAFAVRSTWNRLQRALFSHSSALFV